MDAKVIRAVLLTSCLVACDRVGPAVEIYHPTVSATPNAVQVTAGMDSEAPPVLARLRGASESEGTRVGALDGAPEYVFGEIADIRSTGELVFVLDSRFNTIRVFDEEWRFVESVSGPGPGPGELARPVELVEATETRLSVLDRGGAAKTFEYTGSWDLKHFARLPFMPESSCASAGSVFVRAWATDGTLVHRLTAPDQVVSGDTWSPDGSFAQTYASESPIVSEQLSQGLIECSGGNPRIVEAGRYLPYVGVYGLDGELSHVLQLLDFNQIDIIETRTETSPVPALTLDGTDGYDVIWAMTLLDVDLLLVQFLQLEVPEGGGLQDIQRTIRSYLLDVEGGVSWYVGDGLPRVLDVTETQLLGAVPDPFPTVVAVDY